MPNNDDERKSGKTLLLYVSRCSATLSRFKKLLSRRKLE